MGNLLTTNVEEPPCTERQEVSLRLHCVLQPGEKEPDDNKRQSIINFEANILHANKVEHLGTQCGITDWKRPVYEDDITGAIDVGVGSMDKQESVINWLLDWPNPEHLSAWITLPERFSKKLSAKYNDRSDLVPISISCGTFSSFNTFICCRSYDNAADLVITGSFEHIGLCIYLCESESIHCIEWQARSIGKLFKVNRSKDGVIHIFFHVLEPPFIYEALEPPKELNVKSGKWARRTFLRQFDRTTIGQSDAWKLSFQPNERTKLFNFLMLLHQAKKDVQFVSHLVSSHIVQLPPINFRDRSFDVVWALERFLSCGLKATVKLSNKLIQHLTNNDDAHAVRLLQCFIKEINVEDHYLLNFEPEYIPKHWYVNTTTFSRRSSNELLFIRQVVFTPTRQLFLQEQVVEPNRVFRKYSPEYALKVVFRDEDRVSKLNNIKYYKEGNGEFDVEVLDSCIIKPLHNGLIVGERKYRFLGGSQSMQADHGCYLYATDSKGQTASDIRASVGDLQSNRCVANYMARLGLAFSHTSDTNINIKPRMINDIKGGCDKTGQPYCFSDGIGCISRQTLQMICNNNQYIPSALQIRLGGIKGMVALDPKERGQSIAIRPSMKKFDSSDDKLEIQDSSRPCRLKLNSQIITLLEQLGVDEKVFFKLLNDDLHQYWEGFINNDSMLRILKWKGPRLKYKSITAKAVCLTDYFFFKDCLAFILESHLEDLIYKPQIPIPPDKGRNMFGVLDETGILEYGQVYIRYSTNFKRPGRETQVVKGEVTVSKMPALHPGDVRKLTAVDVTHKLGHLYDVIVFPQKGKRSHPNEMAGSDLDGDMYFVTWHDGLIFKNDNHIAMDFPSAPKLEKSTPIVEQDMIQYMKTYILSDLKGIISSNHLKHADYQKQGIFSDECLKLAEICSLVLDAPKTGNLPDIPYELFLDKTPDFMGGHSFKKTYLSKRVQGKIYRYLKAMRIQLSEGRSMCDALLPNKHAHQSKQTKYVNILTEKYCNLMQQLQEKYQVDELHILCERLPSQVRKDKSFTFEEKRRQLAKDVESLKQIMKTLICEAFLNHEVNQKLLFEECLHMSETKDGKRKGYQGLPWILLECMTQDYKVNDCQLPLSLSLWGDSVLRQIGTGHQKELLTYLKEHNFSKIEYSAFYQSDAVNIVCEFLLQYMSNTKTEDPQQLIQSVLHTASKLKYVILSKEKCIHRSGLKMFFSSIFEEPTKTEALKHCGNLLNEQEKITDVQQLQQIGSLLYNTLLFKCSYNGAGIHPTDSRLWQLVFRVFVQLITTNTCSFQYDQVNDLSKVTSERIVVDKCCFDKVLAEYIDNNHFMEKTGLRALGVQLAIEEGPGGTYSFLVKGNDVGREKAITFIQKINSIDT